ILLFIVIAIVAWVASYAPEMWRRHTVLEALNAPTPHWVCIINSDAVSSQYEAYVTKKYIMLGGERFYSEEFKKWGRGADYILAVIDDSMFMHWTRLDMAETDSLAKNYGIAHVG